MRAAPESVERASLSRSISSKHSHEHLSFSTGGLGVIQNVLPRWAMTTVAVLFAALVVCSAHLYVLIQNGLVVK